MKGNASMAHQNETDASLSQKMTANPTSNISEKCAKCFQRVVWDNVWINLGLALAKGGVGFVGGSKALVADAIHSFSDVITSLVVGLTLKIADRPIDKNHPYGHGKTEYIASLIVAIVLLAAGVTICFSAINAILHRVPVQPSMLTVWVAAISITANEFMFRRTICAAQKMNSPSMKTNAWDNRVDSYSSMATLCGIIGAKLGAHFLDPLAAIIVALSIFRVCGQMMRDALSGLTDSSVAPEQIRQIYDITCGVDGVQSVMDIRARRMGKLIWIDLRIQISSKKTITEGHLIATRIKDAIVSRMEHIGNVMVSVNPVEKHLSHKRFRFSES